jgi:hypothetical protein
MEIIASDRVVKPYGNIITHDILHRLNKFIVMNNFSGVKTPPVKM